MSVNNTVLFFILCANVHLIIAARILVVVPTAAISHQIVFRPLTQELARRGHDVVVITTDPAFPKGRAPNNLTEIDVHDVAYAAKNLGFAEFATGSKDNLFIQVTAFFKLFHTIFEAVIKADDVQTIIKKREDHFDLLILEACVRPALVFSYIFKAPVILFSSIPPLDAINEYTGPAMHPLIYPTALHQKIIDLSLWDKAYELYKHYKFENSIAALAGDGDELLRKYFGANVPPLRELSHNVDMVFLTSSHIWDNNRPIPPSVLYLGQIYPMDSTETLPDDLKQYLDLSAHGVIYMSFGTNVNCSLLPQKAVETFINVFSKLQYDILIRWDTEALPRFSKNVNVSKWLPQSDLLRHPKVKLFITQGGLQSTSDAIAAGVPLIGMPMLGDQWYNVEQYIRLKIGLRLDLESVTEETMLNAIKTTIEDESYRRNIESLRSLLRDQPQSALDRAVWWAEHVIRHKGARHLRAPTALISYWDYFELDLMLTIASCVILLIISVIVILYKIYFAFFCNLQNKICVKGKRE